MKAKSNPVLFEHNIHHTIYFIITGIFIGTLCLINVINISRFVSFECTLFSHVYSFIIPVGIIPYPITFLCTDIVSECYGQKAANRLVTTGLIANITLFILIWLCGLPGTFLPSYIPMEAQTPLGNHFFITRYLTMTAILSSMLAYLVAQYLDVYLFHLLKTMTKDKHLWLRNNVSTCISQFIDTCLVLGSTYFMTRHLAWGNDLTTGTTYSLATIIVSSYGFKLIATLLDTFPCYFFVNLIKKIEAKPKTKTRPRILFS